MRRKHVPVEGWNDEIDEAGAMQAPTPGITTRDVDEELKEIGERVGMSGSLGLVQAGGVTLSASLGVNAVSEGTRKSTIEPDGDVFIGSDIDDPAGLSLAVFVNSQEWNTEEFEEGDMLFGDNSEAQPNIKWDASEGQWQFRSGVTTTVYMDTDGSLRVGDGTILGLDESGITFGVGGAGGLLAYFSNDIFLYNFTAGEQVFLTCTLTNLTTPSVGWGEVSGTANASQLNLGIGAAGVQLYIGGEAIIWGGATGKETVFNEGGYDIDFRIETAASADAFFVNAGADVVDIYQTAFYESNTVAFYGMTWDAIEQRLEIGSDHYFPNSGSDNPNGFWNETNQDMDFTFEGNSGINLISDSGLDAIGIGGAAESGYKLKIHGDMNLLTGATYDIDGAAIALVNLYPTNALSNNVPASSTRYMSPFYVTAPETTERTMIVTRAGIVKNFYVRQTTGSQPASGSLVCHVRKNATSDEISITIPANASGAQTNSETSTSFSVAAGDFIGFKFVNNATGNSIGIGFVAVEVIYNQEQ